MSSKVPESAAKNIDSFGLLIVFFFFFADSRLMDAVDNGYPFDL